MAVAELAEPGSLGRVLAHEGELERIVEAADASPAELAVRWVNAGLYALPAPVVFDYLRQIGTRNAQGELYLTDALGRGRPRPERPSARSTLKTPQRPSASMIAASWRRSTAPCSTAICVS